MRSDTITVFNFHEGTGAWHTTVFSGVSLYETESANATHGNGRVNAATVEAIIDTGVDGNWPPAYRESGAATEKKYIGPKAYAKLESPDGFFTFKPERDFFVKGDHASAPIADEDYDQGLYHHMNDELDDVHMIVSAIFYSLLPHFEIGGR